MRIILKIVSISCLLAAFAAVPEATAQSRNTDLALIGASTVAIDRHEGTSAKKPLKPVLKYNPLFWFLNGSLTAYQKVISPQISAGCLYQTSCSRFSRKAIHEFGIIKGVVLTADRLSRCNRISAAGIHRDRFTPQGLIIDEPYMYRFR